MRSEKINQLKRAQELFSKSFTGKLKSFWLQSLLVLAFLYILIQKDIQIQLHFSSPIKGETIQANEINKNNADLKTVVQASNQFSIVDPNSIKTILETAKAMTESNKEITSHPPIKIKSEKNYPNLLFVLNPTYAERNKISLEIVNKKTEACLQYIKRFAPVALVEKKKYGVPVSIKLAQGLLETDAGKSTLSKTYNNHFGIKCFSTKCNKDHCTNLTDDSHKDFFRRFTTSWESFRAHSLLLQGKRYRHLQKIPAENYQEWASGLKKAGYATDVAYAKKLVRIIEVFQLDQFDS